MHLFISLILSKLRKKIEVQQLLMIQTKPGEVTELLLRFGMKM